MTAPFLGGGGTSNDSLHLVHPLLPVRAWTQARWASRHRLRFADPVAQGGAEHWKRPSTLDLHQALGAQPTCLQRSAQQTCLRVFESLGSVVSVAPGVNSARCTVGGGSASI